MIDAVKFNIQDIQTLITFALLICMWKYLCWFHIVWTFVVYTIWRYVPNWIIYLNFEKKSYFFFNFRIYFVLMVQCFIGIWKTVRKKQNYSIVKLNQPFKGFGCFLESHFLIKIIHWQIVWRLFYYFLFKYVLEIHMEEYYVG